MRCSCLVPSVFCPPGYWGVYQGHAQRKGSLTSETFLGPRTGLLQILKKVEKPPSYKDHTYYFLALKTVKKLSRSCRKVLWPLSLEISKTKLYEAWNNVVSSQQLTLLWGWGELEISWGAPPPFRVVLSRELCLYDLLTCGIQETVPAPTALAHIFSLRVEGLEKIERAQAAQEWETRRQGWRKQVHTPISSPDVHWAAVPHPLQCLLTGSGWLFPMAQPDGLGKSSFSRRISSFEMSYTHTEQSVLCQVRKYGGKSMIHHT